MPSIVRFSLLAVALFGGLLPTTQVVAAEEQSCFDELHTPSCSVPPSGDIDADTAQTVCAMLDMEYLWGFQFNVELHGAALATIPANSDFCQLVRQYYHQCYWCEPDIPSGDYCFFNTCDKPVELDLTVNLDETCQELEQMADRGEYPATMDLCYRAEHAKHRCPVYCGGDNQDDSEPSLLKPHYLNANTTPKKRALVWMPRISALLSFFGACYILQDVLKERDNRSAAYHQLLFGMACFDIITAVAWSLSTRPIPEDDAWYIEGAAGNQASCRTQGFFVQLGTTSIFYNVSLAVYYLLVIVYNWKESALREIRIYLHGVPLVAGLGLALAGIPFYNWTEYGCHFEPPPGDDAWKTLVFAVVPIGLSILFITGAMVCLYVSVRRKSRASRKWSLGFGTNESMETRVFWQALLYTLSFYITWPVVFCVYIRSLDVVAQKYWFSLLFAFVAPLQGFNNFLVYIRRLKAFKLEHFTRASRRVSSIFASTVFRLGSSASNVGQTIEQSSSSLGASAMMARRDAAISQIRETPTNDDDDDDAIAAIKEDPTDRTEEEEDMMIVEAITEEEGSNNEDVEAANVIITVEP